MAFAAGAFGAGGRSPWSNHNHHGQRHGVALINESLAPSQPTDPTLHGVTAGGAPWVLKNGDIELNSGGKLDLRVKGLVIPALGTPGPVTTISASLYCHADTTAADTTQQVPISPKGRRPYPRHVLQGAFHLPRARGPRPPERARDDLHRTGRLAPLGSFREAQASGRR